MSIHHHYSLFNTEQTFDPLLLIYHDKRQTNLSSATLRDRSCTCGVHTWWSWHKQHLDGWAMFSLQEEKKGGGTLLFSKLFNDISIGHAVVKNRGERKTTAKTVTSAALSMLQWKLTTHAFSNSFLLFEMVFIPHIQCSGSKQPAKGVLVKVHFVALW